MAQARFMQDGEDGLAISALHGSGGDNTSAGGSMIITMKSKLDIGVFVRRTRYDKEVMDKEIEESALAYFGSFAMIRPTDESNTGLEVSASYENGTFTSDVLDTSKQKLQGHGFRGGFSLYFRLPSSRNLTIYPSLYAGYLETTLETEDSSNDIVKDRSSGAEFGGALSFYLYRTVHITPSFSLFDGRSTFGLGVGIAISSLN